MYPFTKHGILNYQKTCNVGFKVIMKKKHYTRQLCNFKVKFSKSKIKSNCLSIIGVRLCNKLGDNMKTCRSLLNLKKNVKNNLPEQISRCIFLLWLYLLLTHLMYRDWVIILSTEI